VVGYGVGLNSKTTPKARREEQGMLCNGKSGRGLSFGIKKKPDEGAF